MAHFLVPLGPNGASRGTPVPSRRVRYRTADQNNDGVSRRVPDVTISADAAARGRPKAKARPGAQANTTKLRDDRPGQQLTAIAATRMQQALLSDKGLDLRDQAINAKLF